MSTPWIAAPCLLALISIAPAGRAQTTWIVDSTAIPPGNGTPGSPYAEIQYALGQASTLDGDTLLVLPGTYFENVDFLGKAVLVVSSGGRAATAIDGGATLSVVTFDSGEGPDSVLQGFTLLNGSGYFDMGLTQTVGGGVRIVGSSPTIRDCLVQRNEADLGSGLYCEDGSPRIEDCVLADNTPFLSNPSGGGAWFSGGSPWIVDTLVEDNGVAGWGGGLYFEDSLPSVLRTTVRDNHSSYAEGGGVYLLACPSASFVDCTLAGNRCNDGGWGAGLGAVSSTVTMTGCRVDSNSAFVDHEAGGIGLDHSSLWFTDGEITGNYSARGGGISVGTFTQGGSTLLLEDSIVSGNTAESFQAYDGNGGGVYVSPGSLAMVKRCLFEGNVASSGFGGDGGAVFGAADLEHCTLVGNTANTGGGVCGAALDSCIAYFNTPLDTCSSPDVTYSDVQGGHPGVGNIAALPLFWNASGGDYHLKPGSPCIDTGNPASPSDPDGSQADMGAFPFEGGYCPLPVSYCTAGTSASGCQALISSIGTPSASAPNGFLLLSSGAEGAKDGLFFFGTNGRQANPWGNGTSYQCIVPPLKRGATLNGVGTPGACNGTFAYDLNAHWTAKPASNPGPGVLVQAQLWYRDPQSTSNQSTSLSDALEAGVCPR